MRPPALHPEEWHPEDYFAGACDIGEIDQLDTDDILRREWEGRAVEEREAETSRALDTLPLARVCLVAVRRPADMLAAVG